MPGAIAQALRSQGDEVIGVGITGMALPALKRQVNRCHWVTLDGLGKILAIFQQERIQEVVLAGKVEKEKVLGARDVDHATRQFLDSARNKQDMSLLMSLKQLFERAGVALVPPERYLGGFLAGSGVLTTRLPSDHERQDLEYGVRIAHELTKWDIGQCVVVKDGCVVAVEAMEGTDRMIERAGQLMAGGVVVKFNRPQRSLALDPPVVGLSTLRQMRKARCTALGLQARATVMLDRQKFISQADAWKITVVGLEPLAS